MLSRQFIAAIKMSGIPQYKLAHRFGINPGALSHWINGFAYPQKHDSRLLNLAKHLNVPEDQIFEKKGGV